MLIALVLMGLIANLQGCPDDPCLQAGQVKHIILFIGDGMHLQHEIAASRYLFGTDNGLSFHQLPYQTSVTTWDVNSYDRYAWLLNAPRYTHESFDPTIGYEPAYGGTAPFPMGGAITDGYFLNYLAGWGDNTHDPLSGRQPAADSASTATAIGTGQKTNTGNIAWAMGDPADGALTSLGEQMRAANGALFGVASTVPYNHATIAAFAAHGPDRSQYPSLGESMLREVLPDLVIGGGHPMFYSTAPPNYRFINQNTYDELLAGTLDYHFVERTSGIEGAQVLSDGLEGAAAEGRKAFALFGGSGGNFETPVARDAPDAPLLDPVSTENPLLHEITTLALDYLQSQNSGNGFMVMFEQGDIDWNNHSNNFKGMISTVTGLHLAVQAAVDFVDQPDDDMTWENTLLLVTADHSNSYMRLTDNPVLGAGDLPQQNSLKKDTLDMDCEAHEKAWQHNFTYPGGEVAYHTKGHTNEPVMLYAMGDATCLFTPYEGLWYPGTRLIDNTHIYKVCAEAVGLTVE
jgi:alkaline phosphatase